jgi:hypothetical protein
MLMRVLDASLNSVNIFNIHLAGVAIDTNAHFRMSNAIKAGRHPNHLQQLPQSRSAHTSSVVR